MSNFKKLYLAFFVAIIALSWSNTKAEAPYRDNRTQEKEPEEKKFRAPFLPK